LVYQFLLIFINDGSRSNIGHRREEHEEQGVFVGLVGARFERQGKMEWQHIMITERQNTLENGYGKQDDNNQHTQAETEKKRNISNFGQNSIFVTSQSPKDISPCMTRSRN